VLKIHDFFEYYFYRIAKISEFSDKTLGWMPSGPTELFTFNCFNLVAIST